MTYKPITSAPAQQGSPPGRFTISVEPRHVRGILRSLGYDWQPGTKVLVRLDRGKIDTAYAFIGNGRCNKDEATFYCLK